MMKAIIIVIILVLYRAKSYKIFNIGYGRQNICSERRESSLFAVETSTKTSIVDTKEATVSFEVQGPGHTDKVPSTYSSVDKAQALRIVVTFALIWIIIQEKLNQLQEKLAPSLAMNKLKQVVRLQDGITYQNTIVGSRLPNAGESVEIRAKTSFNGISLKPDEFLRESRQTDAVTFFVNNDFNKNVEDAFGLDGLSSGALEGLMIDGTRKVRLKASQAFSKAAQLPPLVREDDIVTIEISMKSLNTIS